MKKYALTNHQFFKLSTLAGIIASILYQTAYQTAQASVVRDDVDYQYFRDFAENKGQFFVGASNIPIINKSGQNIGTMLADNIPMIDFSSADRNTGYAVALHPQYVVSVKHNVSYSTVSFGGQGNHPEANHYNYQLVDRNNYPDKLNGLNGDYHLPRLHKLITEIVPSETTTAGLDNKTYLDRQRFPYFVRVGSGIQGVRDKQGKTTTIAGGYQYLTGGVPVKIDGRRYAWIDGGSSLFDSVYGPLVTYGLPGDSGSSIWVWDTTVNQWVHYGVLNFFRGEDGVHNTWSITRADWNDKTINEDNQNLDITADNSALIWKTGEKNSTLLDEKGVEQLSLPIYDSTTNNQNIAQNNGKSLILDGKAGSLVLENNINQGAGALYFKTDFTVTGKNSNTTWQGAGVFVEQDKTVNWQVHNPNGDRLSKIGEGTLHVKGTGINQGDISVGDGTVILDQQPDANGIRRAFWRVGIVSGRPTVVLNSADQIKTDNLYFGFRGGRLDVNGNDLSFSRIQNVDEGANIVNNSTTQSANITLTGQPAVTRRFLKYADRVNPNQDLYYWQATPQRRDYFLPQKGKTFPYAYYPTNQQSNENWEYLGSDFEKAAQIAIERANNSDERKITAFNGVFGEKSSEKHNGVLNVDFKPSLPNATLLLSGGLALNGTLTADNGNIILSGRPTPYARIHAKNQATEVIKDDDWINRSFHATTMSAVNDGKLYVGRNVTAVNANFSAADQSALYLGFLNGGTDKQTPVCIRSDYTGHTSCQSHTLSEPIYRTLPTTQITGDIRLSDTSQLNIGKAQLTGQMMADTDTRVYMQGDSTWQMTADSRVGNLQLAQGSRILLNADGGTHTPQTLTIDGQLSGNGRFDYLTDVSQLVGDKVVVNGKATGSHQLYVKDSGKEPSHQRGLGLFVVNGGEEDLSVRLANHDEKVDLGALTYRLVREGNTYYLHNPLSPLPPAIDKGTSVTAEALPSLDIDKKGTSVKAEALPNADISLHGTSVKAEAQPSLDIDIKGTSVTAEALPNADISLHGTSVKAEALPSLDIDKKGTSTSANHLDEWHIRILSEKHGLSAAQLDLVNNTTNTELTDKATDTAQLAGTTPPTAPKTTPSVVPSNVLSQAQSVAPIQSQWISAHANTALSELSAQTHDVLRIGANLNKRLTHEHHDKLAVWVDVSQHDTRYASTNYQAYQQKSTLTQLGAEKSLDNQLYLGASLVNARSDNQFANNIQAHSDTTMLSGYVKKQWSNGMTASVDGSFGHARHQIKDTDVSLGRDVWAVGTQVVGNFDVGLLNLKPSAGVRHYQLANQAYQLGETQINAPKVNLTAYHVGLDVGTTLDVKGVSIRPQLSTQYVGHGQKPMHVHVNNIALNQQFSNYLRHEVSLNAQQGAWAVGAYAGMTSGSEADKQKYAGVKVNYAF